jgi:hypothetical protein
MMYFQINKTNLTVLIVLNIKQRHRIKRSIIPSRKKSTIGKRKGFMTKYFYAKSLTILALAITIEWSIIFNCYPMRP